MYAVIPYVHIYILRVIPNLASNILNAQMSAKSHLILQFVFVFCFVFLLLSAWIISIFQIEQIISLKCDYFHQGAQIKKILYWIAYGECVICGPKIIVLAVDTCSSSATFLWGIAARVVAPSAADSTACLVFRVWWVRGVGQASLPFAHVPVQALGQALEPIVNQVVAADGGHRVAGCGDLDAAEDKWQRQGTGARRETAVDSNGQMVTSPQTGSPVSSCRQTTPRQCSWPRGRGRSNWDGRGGQSQSRPTDKHRHADVPTLTPCTGDTISLGISTSREFWNGLQKPGGGALGPFSLSAKMLQISLHQASTRVQMCWPIFVCEGPKSQLASTEATEKLSLLTE